MTTDQAHPRAGLATGPATTSGDTLSGAAIPPRTEKADRSPLHCERHAAGQCRSCPHLDVPTNEQLQAKQARVAALLAGGGNPVPVRAWAPPAASAMEGFRNKAKMVVSGTVGAPILGILDGNGVGVDLRGCPLHMPVLRNALGVLAGFVTRLGLEPYNVPQRRGELKHLLVTTSPDGDLMVRFVLRSQRQVPELQAALPQLQEALPGLAVVSANIQPVHQAVLEGPEEIVLTEGPGGDRLLMRLNLPGSGVELPLWLPTRSFFQTNTAVAEVLYDQARQWALELLKARADTAEAVDEHRPLRVWDLFCGVGGFALALAGPGREVLGVELSASAIDGARDSARLMGLAPEQARFAAGDARVLDPGAASALGGAPDLLVVNPPRRGIGELAAAVEASGVRRVLYSSCNPASLATDLAAMPSLQVVRARLFDMFPHTDHAEVLVELRRR
ncbi:methyltransferase domain-containing protein [Actinomyces trachealis]|uniref:methyltransferase domain-containing protein n=1 Tax=Actinomyces trachealis TaxID=2763540 RepID=UPI001892BE42|nr:methyltransferase domain-containing protein [Actinomyces trachealis]